MVYTDSHDYPLRRKRWGGLGCFLLALAQTLPNSIIRYARYRSGRALTWGEKFKPSSDYLKSKSCHPQMIPIFRLARIKLNIYNWAVMSSRLPKLPRWDEVQWIEMAHGGRGGGAIYLWVLWGYEEGREREREKEKKERAKRSGMSIVVGLNKIKLIIKSGWLILEKRRGEKLTD
jgi:hypothetical protein